jgi:hypothetical protein
MDFPTAWDIAQKIEPKDHHPRCSFALTNGAILCDCAVLTRHPQYVADYPPDTGEQEP